MFVLLQSVWGIIAALLLFFRRWRGGSILVGGSSIFVGGGSKYVGGVQQRSTPVKYTTVLSCFFLEDVGAVGSFGVFACITTRSKF